MNYCRLYLNAVTLSDLTVTSGRCLDNGKLHGSPSLFSSQSQWMAVRQDKLAEAEWRLWKRANTLWSMEDGTLRQPLGDWIRELSHRRISNFAYRYQHKLYIRAHSGYIRCRMVRGPNKYRETEKIVPKDSIPHGHTRLR